MIFRHRLLDGIAVNRRRRRVDEPLDAVGDAGLEHVERAADIDVERSARKFVALQQPQRREVKDAVHSLQRRVQDVGLADVAARLEDLHPRVAGDILQVLREPRTKLS